MAEQRKKRGGDGGEKRIKEEEGGAEVSRELALKGSREQRAWQKAYGRWNAEVREAFQRRATARKQHPRM